MFAVRTRFGRLLTVFALLLIPTGIPAQGTSGAEPLQRTAEAAAAPAVAAPENWPQFRGHKGMPVSNHPELPTTWSTTENVEWVADVPGMGWSSPIEPRPVYLDFGGGASPAVHGDRIFVLNDSQEGSFLAAFDKRMGERLWINAREGMGDKMLRSGWSTPYVWENELRTEIVTVGPRVAISYDLDGNELWRMRGQGMMAVQTPFAWDGHL